MTNSPHGQLDPLAPLISLAVFGYYGFLNSTTAVITDNAGEIVPLWVGSLWILRVCAVLFAACAAMALVRKPSIAPWGLLAYGIAGAFATLGLLAILVWDQLDQQYFFACPPIILLILVVWNGYSSAMTLRDALR